jgi:hypothetical protein
METVDTDLTPGAARTLFGQKPTNGGGMHPAITIRHSTIQDQLELARLAALDDRPPIGREALLGFVDGELKAAVALAGDQAIADPFEHTAALVELLRLRAAQWPAEGRWAA